MGADPKQHSAAPPSAVNEPPTGAEGTGASRESLMTRLYCEHNQALIRFLLTRVDSEQEAQDVAQEAYVRMLQLDTHGAASYLSAYLFRTAANIAIDRIRRGYRGQRVQRSLANDAAVGTPDGAPSPDHALASQQELALVARFLD